MKDILPVRPATSERYGTYCSQHKHRSRSHLKAYATSCATGISALSLSPFMEKLSGFPPARCLSYVSEKGEPFHPETQLQRGMRNLVLYSLIVQGVLKLHCCKHETALLHFSNICSLRTFPSHKCLASFIFSRTQVEQKTLRSHSN